MAIINTLQKCLESPYLFADPDAPSRVAGLLAVAAERLVAANRIQSGGQADQTDAALLAYEAMFADLRALVYARGYREAGLRCLLLACDKFYVQSGQLNPQFLETFEHVQELKIPTAMVVSAANLFDSRVRELFAEAEAAATPSNSSDAGLHSETPHWKQTGSPPG